MTTPETNVENSIFDWLFTLEDCKAFKVYNGATKGARKPNNSAKKPNGIHDIIGVYKGIFFSIEVKAGKNKMSEDQSLFMQEVIDAGGVSFMSNCPKHCEKTFMSLMRMKGVA